MWRKSINTTAVVLIAIVCSAVTATAQERPNILVIWGDDIGQFNISAYNRGMMGYRTPNIDRIANEGIIFTDAYGENSCTAGRAAFITGQSPFRTGLLKVGLPGAKEGLQPEDPTIAELLKPMGYRTGQFGKNHLGDLDEHLPSNHGFDEFYGNLYHLNAEEEPEHPDYPGEVITGDGRTFAEAFGPRGVIHSYGDGRIEDTGPLNRQRMETVDEEFLDSALEFIDDANDAGEPFFLWFNSTRMHIYTRLKAESEGVTGQGIYADGMVEHDGHVGQLLDKLDELGITDNTLVMYSTDNGAEVMSWPDGGTIPFRGEKNTTWEGGFRVPMMVRWPGRIPAGQVSNEIIEMMALGDTELQLILDYAQAFDSMTDATADGLVERLFQLIEDDQALIREYHGKLSSALGGAIAARFVQVERRIKTLLDLRLAADIPLLEPPR